jgi:hypothetical protein
MLADEQLVLFLHCCQHRLEACKHTIESYYTIRTHAPELFGNRDSRWKDIQQSLSITWVRWPDRHSVVIGIHSGDISANIGIKLITAYGVRNYFTCCCCEFMCHVLPFMNFFIQSAILMNDIRSGLYCEILTVFNLQVTRCINKFNIQHLYALPTLYLCVV